MSNPTVLVVIVNYRTAVMSLRAAEAALAAMQGIDGGVSLVDNDSGDGSLEVMARTVAARGWSDRVRVMQSGRNGGFGAGNNLGICAGLICGGTPDFVHILNPDAFPEPGAIRALVDHMKAHPRTGIAGSALFDADGTPHHSAFRFPSIASEFEGAARCGPISWLLRRFCVPMPLPEATCPVDWVSGASMMMRRSMLDAVGLFDEDYFLYFEETDLCRRARAAGWQTDHVPESRVVHVGSVSTGMKGWERIPRYWLDSRLRYFVSNHGRLYAAGATLAHVAGGLIWRARRLLTGHRRVDPREFLRDLIMHDLGAALRALMLLGHGGTQPELANPPHERRR